MRVQYVGKKPYHVDRIHNTGGVWSEPGAVQTITPDALAEKMIRFHPDVYGPASDDAAVREGAHETAGVIPVGDSAIDTIMVPQGGRDVALRNAKFLALKAYATKVLGLNIAKGTSRPELIDIIVEQVKAGADLLPGNEFPEQPDPDEEDLGEAI